MNELEKSKNDDADSYPSLRTQVISQLSPDDPLVSTVEVIEARGRPQVGEVLDLASQLEAQGHQSTAINVLQAAIPLIRPAERRSLRLRLYYLFRSVGDRKRAADYLTVAGSKGANHAERAYRLAESGRADPATELFRTVIQDSLADEVAAAWLVTFAQVFDLPEPGCGDVSQPAENRHWSPIRKAAVSGMGWSGSGAVYDFLRDSDDVSFVRGESRALEGRYGLLGLLQAIEGGRQELFLRDMFRYTLFGLARCRTYNDYRHVRNARRAVLGSRRREYAWAVQEFVRFILHDGATDTDEVIDRFAPVFDWASRSSLKDDPGSLILLDNVLHISNLHLAPKFKDVTFLATTRDPRDQYVDNFVQNRNFDPDVAKFISRCRSQRETLETVSREPGSNVVAVSFEDFVSDPGVRRRVADIVGVEYSDVRVPGRHFDASQSVTNVGIHRQFADRSTIARIESELGDYCRD